MGVEFAGTAVTSSSAFGADISPQDADPISQFLVEINDQLQWSEGSYRGFFTLTLNPKSAVATYFAMRNVSTPNLDGFASATFVVNAGACYYTLFTHLCADHQFLGANKLSRPVAGGVVHAGAVRNGVTQVLNTTTSE